MTINRIKTTAAALVAALGMGVAGAAQAEILTTADGSGDDFYYRTNSTKINNGGDQLQIKSQGDTGSNNRIPFLKFDTSGLTEPVTSASLRLVLPGTGGADNFDAGETLRLYGVPDGDPNEALGSNAAAEAFLDLADNITGRVVNEGALTFLASITFAEATEGGVIDLFSSQLNSFVAADTNDTLSFVLALDVPSSGTDVVYFGSAESDNPPQLLTNTNAVPEPGSLALLGLGGLAMLGRRRRANG